MFAWVGTQFDGMLNTYVIGVVSALMAAIAPIALTAMTLWIALYGWAILRNEVSETLPAFMWRVFKIGLVFAFALQSGVYITHVADTANALGTGVATTFLPASANPAAISSPFALLDAFNEGASQLVLDLLKDAGITRPDLLFAAVVTAFGNVVFLCIALFIVVLAKVFMTFTIAVGPLFILCLAWRPTARFFDSWLSMLLNSVVLAWFAFFSLGLSASIGEYLVRVVQAEGGFQGPTFNVVAESLKYCIVMVLMAIVCFQAPGLASALTGGVAVQQGVQMLQNVLMVSGLRARGAGGAGGAGRIASQGGTLRAGVGLPFTAGKATATAAAASARMTRQGYGAARTAAYRLAALRGRT